MRRSLLDAAHRIPRFHSSASAARPAGGSNRVLARSALRGRLRQNLLAAEARLNDPDAPSDVAEVVNYVGPMNHGLERLAEMPVSGRLIREIHSKLMEGARGGRPTPGELRTTQNWIGPGGCSLSEAIFVPPPPQEVPQALSDLERFLHAEAAPPALVQVGLAHAQFETIHPFLDGNGRVGRLLITFLLTENKLLARPVLYLSHHFKRRRAEYCERLQAVRDAAGSSITPSSMLAP